jgi:hypothetical protein
MLRPDASGRNGAEPVGERHDVGAFLRSEGPIPETLDEVKRAGDGAKAGAQEGGEAARGGVAADFFWT